MTPSDPAPASGTDVLSVIQSQLENALLGGPLRYTLNEVAELCGLAPARVRRLWQALGLTVDPDPDVVMFTDGDVEALRATAAIIASGAIDESLEVPAARSIGQSMSRLTEWQLNLLNTHVFTQLASAYEKAETPPQEEEIRALIDHIVDRTTELAVSLQSHMWRRHLVATTARAAARPQDSGELHELVVGFADMVGYTRLTRQIDAAALSELLDYFESEVSDVIARHNGWVIKTVGDEVMFAAERPVDAARIALELQDSFGSQKDYPDLRIGLAWGQALPRFGDLFGSVVNIAARLTGAARPGTILVDEDLADALADCEEFRFQTVRTLRLRDFQHSRLYVLRRPREEKKAAVGADGLRDEDMGL
ncbi:adenylate/guanylate cyclase domain-containing protein [Rhodococcus rhodochrous]|uniref:adenylate/guanylate cyclase domain-containing protein n=1 Tax=Rhodococcus rhodochrous TaxID=1829 RepID=UPI0024B8E986|nr:adenylate/guanylate cyclase domain-containing protein [Rhodococcus rhodochrous]MDJ0399241.1 adenylate/guanylate cyclase domain-containing protein [Rhodococcus rhodochrous]